MENKKKNNTVALVICVVAFMSCIFINSMLSRAGNNPYGGLLGQIEVVASLLMVLFAKKLGFLVGCILNGINAFIILFSQVILAGRTAALPGVAVSLISIVTLAIIYYYVSKNEKINAELSDSYEKAVQQANELKEKDESLRFLAYYDTLTSMPNRAMFIERLNECIKDSKPSTILYIDLDNFRHINDTFGHNLGDDLLIKYAAKLNRLCGSDIFAAKIGGDEFGIILGKGMEDSDSVNKFAADIARLLSEPIDIRGDVFTMTASFGAASFPKDTRSAEDLFRCAETAMFTAKANGKNQLCFYVRK